MLAPKAMPRGGACAQSDLAIKLAPLGNGLNNEGAKGSGDDARSLMGVVVMLGRCSDNVRLQSPFKTRQILYSMKSLQEHSKSVPFTQPL